MATLECAHCHNQITIPKTEGHFFCVHCGHPNIATASPAANTTAKVFEPSGAGEAPATVGDKIGRPRWKLMAIALLLLLGFLGILAYDFICLHAACANDPEARIAALQDYKKAAIFLSGLAQSRIDGARIELDEAAWSQATMACAPLDYIKNLKAYLRGATLRAHAAEAKERIEEQETLRDEQAWEAAKKSGPVQECLRRIDDYLAGDTKLAHAEHARALRKERLEEQETLRDEQAWEAAKKSGPVREWLRRIDDYLAGDTKLTHAEHARALKTRIKEDDEWERATKAGAEPSESLLRIQDYIKDRLAERYRDMAGQVENRLKQEVDDSAFKAADAAGEPQDWLNRLNAYLAADTLKTHRAEAESRSKDLSGQIDDNAFKTARAEAPFKDRLEKIEFYLSGQTLLAHKAEALALKASVLDDQAWAAAKIKDSDFADWIARIQTYLAGPTIKAHAQEAQEYLPLLRDMLAEQQYNKATTRALNEAAVSFIKRLEDYVAETTKHLDDFEAKDPRRRTREKYIESAKAVLEIQGKALEENTWQLARSEKGTWGERGARLESYLKGATAKSHEADARALLEELHKQMLAHPLLVIPEMAEHGELNTNRQIQNWDAKQTKGQLLALILAQRLFDENYKQIRYGALGPKDAEGYVPGSLFEFRTTLRTFEFETSTQHSPLAGMVPWKKVTVQINWELRDAKSKEVLKEGAARGDADGPTDETSNKLDYPFDSQKFKESISGKAVKKALEKFRGDYLGIVGREREPHE